MNYCSVCGAPVTLKVPAGDSLPRHVCDACGAIHYRNPRLVVGALPEWEDRILLCRRAIEPRHGKWTLPAGFMELNETTAQGAVRETNEEAGAQFELGPLFTLMNVRRVGQVHMYYRATLLSDQFDPGHETLEARLFEESEVPWEELAFRTVKETLRHFFADWHAGEFGFHCQDID